MTYELGITITGASATLPVFPRQRPRILATIDPARYRICRELARGGMGRVSIADDLLLGRTVALKEMLVTDDRLVDRFARELAVTLRLNHPSIVAALDGGMWPSGELVYVMRLVEGEPMDRTVERCRTLAERMALIPHVIAVCDAVAYAHVHGVIHCDLKPANILVGEHGETVIVDWGLARDLYDDDGDLHEIIGTPAYMPPQQASGTPGDERADIYALGATLYFLLAGVPPYSGSTATDVLTSVLTSPPTPLDERAPSTPRDLLAIVGKAMARDPRERYATATELAADLRRFECGVRIEARPPAVQPRPWRIFSGRSARS